MSLYITIADPSLLRAALLAGVPVGPRRDEIERKLIEGRERAQLRRIPTIDLRAAVSWTPDQYDPRTRNSGDPLRNRELWPLGMPVRGDEWHRIEWAR